MLAPRGRLLVSILNPWFVGDARYGWWWRGLPSLLRSGGYSVPGAQAPIQRRSIHHTRRSRTPGSISRRFIATSCRRAPGSRCAYLADIGRRAPY
jgi:hypothetical protein